MDYFISVSFEEIKDIYESELFISDIYDVNFNIYVFFIFEVVEVIVS